MDDKSKKLICSTCHRRKHSQDFVLRCLYCDSYGGYEDFYKITTLDEVKDILHIDDGMGYKNE